jgi:U4/U6.U5 tri-snRNP-associated protein 1
MVSKPVPTLSGGMAGALALLRQQGAVQAQTKDEKERELVQRERDLWLADHRRRTAKRELERIKARGGNKDQAQREWENKMREQAEAREALSAYANYKPDINIVYTDEFGRNMTPKEAWKSLSHKFHGKTSGRMKTELRLRRIEEERKSLTMGTGDTPSGMLHAFSRRQEATGEAYMTLSVGARR